MAIPVSEIFEHFEQTTVLIIGDVMLDTYYFGQATRISPEAPVPVVDIVNKESRLGGAANVALNVKSLGANAVLCSVTGDDEQATQLKTLLEDNDIDYKGIIKSNQRITTEKSRIFSRNQQMIRFDQEWEKDLSPDEEGLLMTAIEQSINQQKIDVIILQDYNKGVLTKNIIRYIIEASEESNIPVAVDPKSRNFYEYVNVSLFKPNLKEINGALNSMISSDDLESLANAAKQLESRLNHDLTLITLSNKGIFVSDHEESEIIPATIRNVSDVSGAGDTVISVAALCLAQGLDKNTIATLSNIAGGLACENVGVIAINKETFFENVTKGMVHG